MKMQQRLIASDEVDPVMIEYPEGASPFFLVCDHAANRIPRRLGTLGLSGQEISRHIGWDIGVWEVSRKIAFALDAFLIGQAYSRLVIDCNRPTTSLTSIPEVSEATAIPGNIAKTVARQIMASGKIQRSWLGMEGGTKLFVQD